MERHGIASAESGSALLCIHAAGWDADRTYSSGGGGSKLNMHGLEDWPFDAAVETSLVVQSGNKRGHTSQLHQ